MNRGRIAITVLLVVSLLFTAAARWLSDRQRYAVLTNDGQQPLTTAGSGTLSGMDSFALALLLGGLRGPLVMILWQQSESQKQEKNLEGFDTQVEWIRMLQPEFDSVHIFQIWNKAYNISVQMASLANKYITILDALDYAYRTDAERPHNINILTAIAQVYFDKLGNSAEKEYYRERVRSESQWRDDSSDRSRASTVRMTRLQPRLDPEGNILPEYLHGTLQRPETLAPDQPWNTGADLQYLKEFEPFEYGISPFAFAYNYHKRAQVLQKVAGQRHSQLGSTVLDSRPALALKFWAEAEFERSRRREADMLGVRAYTEQEQQARRPFGDLIVDPAAQFDVLTAELPIAEQPLEDERLAEIMYGYERTAEIAEAAIREYELHLDNTEYVINASTYESHIADVKVLRAIASADHAYLQGIAAPAGSAERRSQLEQAAALYRDTIEQSYVIMLRYFTDAGALREAGVEREQIAQMSPAQRAAALQRVLALFSAGAYDPHAEDRGEYARYVERAETRLELLSQAGIE